MSAKFSGYNASKFAALKMLETLARENEDLHVVSMHPGVGKLCLKDQRNASFLRVLRFRDLLTPSMTVETDMAAKTMKGKDFKLRRLDTVELPSHFAVWLCSDEAKFLRGKFVWCNWDVEELKAKKGEIDGSLLLTGNCIGWPYSP